MATPRVEDSLFLPIWPKLNGPKLWIEVAGLTHTGMMDMPTLLHATGLDTEIPTDLLGTIDPAEWVRIMAAYAAEWLNGAFSGKVGGPLLEGQEPDRFSEVSVVRKENF